MPIEPDDDATRINDAKVDRAGRLWGGTMAIDARPDAGSLYRIDAEGGLWVAMYRGWSVRRFSPDGRLDRRIELPAEKITSCAFGGPELDDLFVTSASDGLSHADLACQPLAGALFVVDPGVAGLPATAYAGREPRPARVAPRDRLPSGRTTRSAGSPWRSMSS